MIVGELYIYTLFIVSLILFICAYQDIKKKEVDHKYTSLIMVLFLPLLFVNKIAYINIILSALLILLYFFKSLGMADLKVLVPMMSALPWSGLLIFWKVAIPSFIIVSIFYIIEERKIVGLRVPMFPSIFVGSIFYLMNLIYQ